MMYRTHCQRILDTVLRANFDEVYNAMLTLTFDENCNKNISFVTTF